MYRYKNEETSTIYRFATHEAALAAYNAYKGVSDASEEEEESSEEEASSDE
jgi:hypothetical protein